MDIVCLFNNWKPQYCQFIHHKCCDQMLIFSSFFHSKNEKKKSLTFSIESSTQRFPLEYNTLFDWNEIKCFDWSADIPCTWHHSLEGSISPWKSNSNWKVTRFNVWRFVRHFNIVYNENAVKSRHGFTTYTCFWHKHSIRIDSIDCELDTFTTHTIRCANIFQHNRKFTQNKQILAYIRRTYYFHWPSENVTNWTVLLNRKK